MYTIVLEPRLEQRIDDEAADVARAYDCEFLEARPVCQCDKWDG